MIEVLVTLAAVVGLARQMRLRAREKDEIRLARHIFDQTRRADVMLDLAKVRAADSITGVLERRRREDDPPDSG